MIFVVILGMFQHQIDPGGDVVIGGIAGLSAIGAVDNAVGVDGIPVLDPGRLAVGTVWRQKSLLQKVSKSY